jgi:dienelactone hydrolase
MFPRKTILTILICVSLIAVLTTTIGLADDSNVTRTRDVVYAHRHGVGLTLDVFQPEKPNGAGIIEIVSRGWHSNHDWLGEGTGYGCPFTDRGYTVFAVLHGSQPRYKVEEIITQIHRAVRFIRTAADRWGVDPNKLGITGGSAGGHLSLMIATCGGEGDAKVEDPVDRAGSVVQAAAVFYPPTDYLNWFEEGDVAVGVGRLADYRDAFGPKAATADGRLELGRAVSPIYHVTKKTPPIRIIHGDKDGEVSLYQSQVFEQKCKEVGVTCEVIVKKGAGHGWSNMHVDREKFADWFDTHLLKKGKADSGR